MPEDIALIESLRANVAEKEKLIRLQEDKILLLKDTLRKVKEVSQVIIKIAELEVE